MLALVLAVLTEASPSPLPIIITTKSSPICQTLREKVAPAISRVVYEDQVMARQRPLGTKSVALDALVINWVKLDELLNPDTFFHSDDPAQNQRMESLRKRLQKVADDENNALNVLSGAYYTEEMQALAGGGDGMSGANGILTKPDKIPPILFAMRYLEEEYLRRESVTQQEELLVYPELQPIISACS
jgi:hypothetical protein